MYRHDQITRVLARACDHARLPYQLEQRLHSTSHSRPGDIAIQFTNTEITYADVGICNPCARTYLTHSATTAGSAAAQYAAKKTSKYQRSFLTHSGIIPSGMTPTFSPLVGETFGGWCPEAVRVLKKIAGAQASISPSTGVPHVDHLHHLITLLDIKLQSLNARAILTHNTSTNIQNSTPVRSSSIFNIPFFSTTSVLHRLASQGLSNVDSDR